MTSSAMCRACLSSKFGTYRLGGTGLQEKFETLTKIKFTTGDGQPDNLCYLCCALLQKFHRFVVMAQCSDRVLSHFLELGIQMTKHTVSQLNIRKPNFIVSHLKSISINITPKTPVVNEVKKEVIEFNKNTYAEIVQMNDILRDFEQFPSNENAKIVKVEDENFDIPVNIEQGTITNKHYMDSNNTMDIKQEVTIMSQQNKDIKSAINLEPTIDDDCNILDNTSIKLELSSNDDHKEEDCVILECNNQTIDIEEIEDCVILECKDQPIVIEEIDSDVCSENEEIPLVLDVKHNILKRSHPLASVALAASLTVRNNKKPVLNNVIKDKFEQGPIKEQVDSIKQQHMNMNGISRDDPSEQKNAIWSSFSKQQNTKEYTAESKNTKTSSQISQSLGPSQLQPCDFGIQKASSDDDEPEIDTEIQPSSLFKHCSDYIKQTPCKVGNKSRPSQLQPCDFGIQKASSDDDEPELDTEIQPSSLFKHCSDYEKQTPWKGGNKSRPSRLQPCDFEIQKERNKKRKKENRFIHKQKQTKAGTNDDEPKIDTEMQLSSLFKRYSDYEKQSRTVCNGGNRSDRSRLHSCDFGMHQACSHENEPTTFVPFGFGTQMYNIGSSNSESEKSSSAKKKGRKRKEYFLPQDANNYQYYFCEDCFSSFNSIRRLKRHIKRIHPDKKTYVCSQCDKIYSSNKNLKEHLSLNHPVKMYHCDKCKKKYQSLKYFLLHKKQVHSEPIKIYSCDTCRKKYVQHLSFKYHILFVHPPPRSKRLDLF